MIVHTKKLSITIFSDKFDIPLSGKALVRSAEEVTELKLAAAVRLSHDNRLSNRSVDLFRTDVI